MRILGVSGSLRAESSNTKMLKTLRIFGGETLQLNVWSGLGDLPPFNPDIELFSPAEDARMTAVQNWRAALAASDAVLIACPEYGHSIPGVLKNALDWVVGTGELVNKPVAITNAYANRMRGSYVRAALAECLRAMNAHLIEQSLPAPELDASVFAYSVRDCLEELKRAHLAA